MRRGSSHACCASCRVWAEIVWRNVARSGSHKSHPSYCGECCRSRHFERLSIITLRCSLVASRGGVARLKRTAKQTHCEVVLPRAAEQPQHGKSWVAEDVLHRALGMPLRWLGVCVRGSTSGVAYWPAMTRASAQFPNASFPSKTSIRHFTLLMSTSISWGAESLVMILLSQSTWFAKKSSL